eukprot:SAG11_NODE_1103_length_5862_cov_8.036439_2_plen_145_part_00
MGAAACMPPRQACVFASTARHKTSIIAPSHTLPLIVEQLLRTVGTTQDIDQFINFYKHDDVMHSAVIKVGGEVIRDELDTFAIALTTLYQVGLFPIVVHGAGEFEDSRDFAVTICAKLEPPCMHPRFLGTYVGRLFVRCLVLFL